MILPPPSVPWQITGNHWACLPCIHPRDAAIHLVGFVNSTTRSAIEFAGSEDYSDGNGAPLIALRVTIDGSPKVIGGAGMLWERELSWLPTFSCVVDDVAMRGTIFAPCGRDADLPGAIIALSLENRSSRSLQIAVGVGGTLGHRQSRIRSPETLSDAHWARTAENCVVLGGKGVPSLCAIAVGSDGDADVQVADADLPTWSITRTVTLEPGEKSELGFLMAAASESDGAVATLRVMRRRGWRALLALTRETLNRLCQSTGFAAVDGLINRNLMFAFFTGVARGIDDGRIYPLRSRMPWNGRGITVTDWETLIWMLPAIQLANVELARETLLRMCEMHGAQPGNGVRYIDGTLFEAGFSLESLAAYAIAVDEYVVQTGDERIVDEPVLAETLYGAHEDLERFKHPRIPLYMTELNPDGSIPEYPYTIHGNAAAAFALEVFARTLDEKTAERVQDAEAVRASALRHFSIEGTDGRVRLVSSSDLEAGKNLADDPSASVYWLPYFHLIGRDDSRYRRTVKQWEARSPEQLVARCARLVGPSTSEVLDWLRRAPLDGGVAAELVDENGRVTGNGGDAALSGTVAYLVWYSVHALGAKL
jgi:hypothetical protein